MCAAPEGARAVGRLALLGLVLIVAACGHLSLSDVERRNLDERYLGKVFEVRHTSIIGDLYDDNERELLSPYPFEDVFHQVDLQGAPIHPSHPRALVPAGTKVRIARICHPSPLSFTQRMLATPRDAIWLQLDVLPEHKERAPFARPPLVLPLSAHLTGAASVDTAVARYLAPEGEVSRWLSGRKPQVALAIAHKEAVMGMSREEMETALGPPWRWFMDTLPDGTSLRVAWYPKHELWLHNETVVATRPSRLVTH